MLESLKEIAETVFGIFLVLGLLYLRLKLFEGSQDHRDLLDRSKVRTLFDKERDRTKF